MKGFQLGLVGVPESVCQAFVACVDDCMVLVDVLQADSLLFNPSLGCYSVVVVGEDLKDVGRTLAGLLPVVPVVLVTADGSPPSDDLGCQAFHIAATLKLGDILRRPQHALSVIDACAWD